MHYKRWCYTTVNKLYFEVGLFFGYLSFTTVRGKKIGFNSCEFLKFLNIAKFHALHVWGKRILNCNDTTFIFHFFSFFCFCNATFFHFGYVIKPPHPSSAIYGAPPFTSNSKNFMATLMLYLRTNWQWHVLHWLISRFVWYVFLVFLMRKLDTVV